MQALYRKYRSLTLDSVVGQEHITAPLAAALTAGKLSHAYLLTGPRGVGKTSVARILAHEINHFPYTLEDNYVDIIEIDAASHTGVDNIRDLLERAELAPTLGTHKVYIIDEVHMLSRSAFNALLKTLEEPPAHVIFLLATTDVEKVPVTILSRTQQLKFRLAPTTTLAAHLTKIAQTEKINITPDAVTLLAELAAGSFRDALSLLDQVSNLTGEITKPALETAFGLASRAIITQILTEAAAGNWPQAIAFLDEVCYNDNIGAIQPQLVEQLVATILDSHMAALYPLAARLAAALADPSALPLSLKVKLAFLEQLPPTTGSALAEPHSPRQDFDNNGVAGTKSLAGRSPSLSGSGGANRP
jgi:DNA polymerase-3 subunit gamma/tau